MGRKKKYKTKEEVLYARKLRNKRYYEKFKHKLNECRMAKYWKEKWDIQNIK